MPSLRKAVALIVLSCLLAGAMEIGDAFAQAKDQPVIKNYLRVKAILREDSPIYSEPSTSSQAVDRAKQFSIVFIFYPGGGPDYVQSGFYRVGKEPDQVLGWIPQQSLREWNHRLVLHFSPLVGRQPALVYGAQNEVEVAVRSMATPDRNRAIAEEPGDISANRYSMLLPVLAPLNITSSNQMRKAYQIGYLAGGDQGAPKIQAPGSGGSSDASNAAGKETALLELMFVMDATASMAPYIEGAKKVITQLAKQVQSMQEAGTKIGISCYRDYVPNQPSIGFVTKNFSPLNRDLTEVIRIIDTEVKNTEVSSEDYQEAAFDGLYAAITETNWDKEKSSLRIIIWVGDASGHPEGHEKNPMKYSLQQIMQKASDNRVRIIAIKIQSQNPEDNQIHRDQAQKISEGVGAGDKGFFTEVDISPSMTEEYVKEVVANVETEIARMGRLVSVSKAANPVQAAQQLPSTDRAIILKNLKPRAQGAKEVEFSEGWVAERDHENHVQVKPYAFMAYDDLALNIFYLTTAQTLASSPTEKVFQAIAEAVHTQTGEKWEEGETLQAHYEKKFGLPASSDLLRFDPKELATWGEQRRTDLAEAIKGKVKLMETHRDDPANWYKLGQKDFRYTFVPLEYLP